MAAPTLLLHLLPSGFKASSLPSFLENEVDDGMEQGKKEAADKGQERKQKKKKRGCMVGWLDGWLLSGGTNPEDVVPCRLNEYLRHVGLATNIIQLPSQ